MLKTQFINQKHVVSILVILLIALTHLTSYADATPVIERTPQVRDAIVAAVPGINTASDVTETHLAAITALDLRAAGISALKTGDFSGLTGLTNLNLYNNELSSLPNGIFKGLTALTDLRLGGNTVDPLPITVSIEKLDNDQFKVVVPTGAPFDIVLPLSAMNGSISGDAVSVTISKGSTESSALTVSRTAETTAAVTVDVSTLPSLPSGHHYGYVLSKSDALPLEVIGEVTPPPVAPDPVVSEPDPDPVVPDPVVPDPDPETPTNTAPMFSDGDITTRIVAENTAAGVNIGSAVAATDADTSDTLTWTLGGIDAAAFDIDSTTGQLTTKAALDYETKRVYSVSITVSDGNLTDTIRVIISIIDTADTALVSMSLPVSQRTPQVHDAIIAAVPGVSSANNVTDAHLAAITSLNLRGAAISALKTGDFSGLTGLTSLNLHNNILSSLPNGIFAGLTALTSLRLGGNLVDPMPLIVSLQQVDANQFQAVIPTGAPFDIVLPIDAMMVTIPKGSFTSAPFTVVDMATVNIDALPSLPANHFGYAFSKSTVCNRTPEVAEAIAAAVPGVTDCRNVSDIQLATITNLDLSGKGITALSSDDFAGMLSLTTLNLSNNILSSLPDGIFDDLPSLTTLDLSGNSVSPFPFTVSLQKIGENMLKTVVPIGAPFDIAVPVIIKTGNTLTGTINLTIPQGSRESQLGTVTRTAGTTAAVTADIGTLPSLPATHTGYALVKTNQQPLEVLSDINVAPVFTAGVSATRSIVENTAAGTNIGDAIAATDVDNDTLTYTLSGTDAASFDIDSATGQLQTKAALDYEMKSSHLVTVSVSDGTLTDSITVTITVIDIDENRAPVFTEGESATRSIAENTTAGMNIGEPISATDADNDTLTYSLGGTDASVFAIDTKSGQLKTSTALDFETQTSYSLTITVSDGKLTGVINVTISVTDVDEKPETDDPVTTKDSTPTNNAPVFTAGESTTRSVAENTGAGVDIGSAVSATDADEHTLTWTLGGIDASSFSIDSTTGQLRTSAALDYGTKTSYTVTITVSDGSLTDTINVSITVTDIDETIPNRAPIFTEGDSTTRIVAENTEAGVNIGTAIAATDPDGNTLIYTLGGTDATAFEIDSTTGQLKTKAALDYETKNAYTVMVTVSDGSLTDTINVNINISDANDAPVFTEENATTRTVTENSAVGVHIETPVIATDADGNILTYTIDGADVASFEVDNTTGQLKTEKTLDFETQSSYKITVIVSDGSLADTINVTINVSNVNEAPVFIEGDSTTRSVTEKTLAGVEIGTAIAATDPDNDTLTYTLDGKDAATFDIDSTTGQLQTKAALDYESQTSYSVRLTVSDGDLTDTIAVSINITDIDETIPNRAPIFVEGDSTTRAVVENTAAGVNIGTAIAATDPDGNTLIYTLGGTDATAFEIDSTTGQLKTKAALDYETKNAYTVMVTVSDGSLTDTINVNINISDANDAPVFTEANATTRTVTENAAVGVHIGTPVIATDADGNILTYTIDGADVASFEVDNTTGQLKTEKTLDFESQSSYKITVIVSDGSLTDTINVTINVSNVNEAPVFTEGETTTRSVAANTIAGVSIGSAVSATDPDSNTLTYTLGGTDAASYDIDSTTGQLKTKAALDYETKNAYALTITVSDGSLTDTINVTIEVTDIDEIVPNRAPIFVEGDSTTRLVDQEAEQGVNIGTPVLATDADDDTLTYTLGGTDAALFDIVSTTGQLKTKVPLDIETKPSYTVTVTASDDSRTDIITVTIYTSFVDINNPPVFTDGPSTTRAVAENTATGTNIGSPVSATDADNNTLAYFLSGDDASAFSIDPNTGQLKTSAALDYEKKSTYSVTVTVSDSSLTDTISVTINVTDVNEAPVFPADSATRTVAENTVAATNIGAAFTATDADNDTLTYTLGGADAAAFTIVSTTGQLKTRAALDYETKNAYTLTITVSDGSLTDVINVNINVTNENDAPVFAEGNTATRAVAENTATGVNIGAAVAATDPDGNTLTYTLGGMDADAFAIVSASGQLKTKAALDYETKNTYSVTITVSDGGLTDTISVTINVTDVNEAPVFPADSATRTVAENTVAATNIGAAFTATDADNDTLTYTLGGADAAAFAIVSTTGQLKTRAALDYETKNAYTLTITVSDGSLTDVINVNINVTNENDAPVFAEGNTATRAVAENTATGVNIGAAVAATDPDGNTLTYTLGGMDADAFAIVSASGQLKTKAALDYETKNTYSVTITVSDGGLTDTISVTINVTDVNEAPVFPADSATRTVAENTVAATNIGAAFTATDADNDTLTYTLGGADGGSFAIVNSSGQLRTSALLNFEAKSKYSVKITVSDGSLTDTIDVTINVTDVDENRAPVFTEGDETTRSVAENTGDGNNIGAPVSATDADNDTLTYTLSGTDASSFDIDSTTGQLQTKTVLDYESRTSYSVRLTVSDGDLTDTIAVSINITDIDETPPNRAPIFVEGDSTTREILEKLTNSCLTISRSTLGITIGTPISATDADDDTLTYTLGGTDAADFDIDSTSGQLKTKAALMLDYETKNVYTLTVSVSDGNGGSDSIAVTINIIDQPTEITFLFKRDPAIAAALVEAAGVSANEVTDSHLAAITSLSINNTSISYISSCLDFNGLTALTHLDLSNNEIERIFGSLSEKMPALTHLDLSNNNINSLPSGIFEGMSSLETLNLSGNDPQPPCYTCGANRPFLISVQFEKVAEGQFKVVMPTGAPFNVSVLISIPGGRGSISGEAETNVTITTGSVESDILTVTRTAGTTGPVSVNMGNLPVIPTNHSGYGLTSPRGQITVISSENAAPVAMGAAVPPAETALLTNFPNPFNPEDVDTLSSHKSERCTDYYLQCAWCRGSGIEFRTSAGRILHQQKPCRLLGW